MPAFDSWSATTTVPTSSDARIAALTAPGIKWAGSAITYSFPQQGAQWVSSYPDGNGTGPPDIGFTPLPAYREDMFRSAMGKWADVINLGISETTDSASVGDIRAAYYGGGPSYVGFAYYPSDSPWGGDVWLQPPYGGVEPDPAKAKLDGDYTIMLHEIGHALGLSHPTDGSVWLPPALLHTQYTVMRTESDFNLNPTTPMVLDVLAAQYLYGANHNTRAGNDTYAYGDSQVYDETIWDGGGNDTLAYTGTRDAKIDINDGHSSRLGLALYDVVNGVLTNYDNVWIAYGANIENAAGGSGNDTLIGNPFDNTLDGGGGRDTVIAASAHTAYTFSQAGAGFTMSGVDGTDTLVNVERVNFSDGYGAALDINGDAGLAYRLYQAAFDRRPDLPGLGYQMNDLDQGVSLEQVASNFIASPEFQTTYGATDNTQFITLLYANVLHRAPDSGGLQFHLDEFAHGESRAEMLIHFSESPENQANVIGQIGNGMLYVPVG